MTTDTVRPAPRQRIRLTLPGKHVSLVLQGKQTAWVREATAAGGQPPVRVGERLTVVKAGGRRVCQVAVTDVHASTLGAVDYHSARACGFRTTQDWQQHMAPRLVPRLTAVPLDDLPPAVDEVWPRLTSRPCWIIRFRYTPDLQERFIRRGVGHETDAPATADEARGYTRNPGLALPGEPPAVDDATLHEFAEAARQRHARRATDRREQAAQVAREQPDELAMRLTALRTIARQKGLNIEGDVRVLTDRINRLARKVKEAA